MKKRDNLLEDAKKCLTDPVFNVIKNFSKEKSKEHYDKWAKAWANWMIVDNPAGKEEWIEFPCADLSEMATKSKEAQTLYENMKNLDYIKTLDWRVAWQTIKISRRRLKTFEEWLEVWIRDALIEAIKYPEDGVKILLKNEWYPGLYTNTDIHMYTEWQISLEILDRIGTFERYNSLEDVDIEECVTQAMKAMKDIEENNKDVTVLELKK